MKLKIPIQKRDLKALEKACFLLWEASKTDTTIHGITDRYNLQLLAALIVKKSEQMQWRKALHKGILSPDLNMIRTLTYRHHKHSTGLYETIHIFHFLTKAEQQLISSQI